MSIEMEGRNPSFLSELGLMRQKGSKGQGRKMNLDGERGRGDAARTLNVS